MNEFKKKQPREFWKLFKSKTKTNAGQDIPITDFHEYFRTLSNQGNAFSNPEVDTFMQDFESSDRGDPAFSELDEPISQEEIKKASKKLNPNKACALDSIINEYLKESMNVILQPLQNLFNYTLDKKSFPRQWAKGVIIPIYKKGDPNEPSNYRGITLVSCLGKLFTIIVNERLKKWALQNDIITDAQFGFKADYSTVDAIFILDSFINKMIKNKKKLYCAFIDLKRAFDSVYRKGLWFKLINSGINGKLFDLIRSIYHEVKSCVKNMNTLSDFFKSEVGLLQGEVLSPFLFSLFLNDLELYLQQDQNAGLTLEQLSIYLLLFADDAVLFSDTIEGLQSSLNNLESYCNKWILEVNVDKTKIVVFRKAGILNRREVWTYGGSEIEIVSSFNYLGIVLSSGGTYLKAINTLAGKGLKAMNCLFAITRTMEIPLNIMFNLFDSFVASILNYGCEIWGFARAERIEMVHKKFCKWVLNVKMQTNNLSLAGELGRFPLFIGRQVRIIKYWLNLQNGKQENCILRTLNMNMRNEVENDSGVVSWTSKVKNLLELSGFPDVWLFPESVDAKKFMPILQARLRDIYITEWREGINLSTALYMYKEIKQTFELSSYLLVIHKRKLRNAIAKLRLSSHRLSIEVGRHRNIPRWERKCTLCNRNDLEDEYHFTLICPSYTDLRQQYIQRYFYVNPSVLKYITLMNSTKAKVLRNLAIYITKAFKLRDSLINETR